MTLDTKALTARIRAEVTALKDRLNAEGLLRYSDHVENCIDEFTEQAEKAYADDAHKCQIECYVDDPYQFTIMMYMFDDSKEEVFSCEIDVTNEYFEKWEITYIKTSD
jgi:hypothetical protein